MAKAAKTAKTKEVPVKSEKKLLREQIATTLASTFDSLKEALGEKKFGKKVKKASKVLGSGAVKKDKEIKKEKK